MPKSIFKQFQTVQTMMITSQFQGQFIGQVPLAIWWGDSLAGLKVRSTKQLYFSALSQVSI